MRCSGNSSWVTLVAIHGLQVVQVQSIISDLRPITNPIPWRMTFDSSSWSALIPYPKTQSIAVLMYVLPYFIRIDESLREIVLGRFVGCDELRVKVAVERALGINLLKKCAAKDFCDAACSDPTWVFQLASPPWHRCSMQHSNLYLTRQMQRVDCKSICIAVLPVKRLGLDARLVDASPLETQNLIYADKHDG